MKKKAIREILDSMMLREYALCRNQSYKTTLIYKMVKYSLILSSLEAQAATTYRMEQNINSKYSTSNINIEQLVKMLMLKRGGGEAYEMG